MMLRSSSTQFALRLLLLPITAIVIGSCTGDSPNEPTPADGAAAFDSEVPVSWMKLQLDLVQGTAGFTPPVAARAFGYSGLALYEAVRPGIPAAVSLQGQLNGLSQGAIPEPTATPSLHWPLVANAALASITRDLFANATPEMVQRIDQLEDSLSGLYGDLNEQDRLASVEYGRSVASAVFEYSRSDGGHEGYLRNFPGDFVPTGEPGTWVPTERRGGPPQSALQPHWGENRPFVLPHGSPNQGIDPGAPPAYSEEVGSDFYREALEVYDTIRTLDEEERKIALFWSDDPGTTCTPPGHSISILLQCLSETEKRLDFAARAYAMLGIAVSDAFVACWESKYRYNLVRPLTYIKEVIDADFSYSDLPVNTPPFPEYTSGHSVQSGAMSGVMDALFGSPFAFEDHTHDRLGMEPRQFESFRAAAAEAAISRLYGGIHFRAAIERGVTQGEAVAAQVGNLNWGD